MNAHSQPRSSHPNTNNCYCFIFKLPLGVQNWCVVIYKHSAVNPELRMKNLNIISIQYNLFLPFSTSLHMLFSYSVCYQALSLNLETRMTCHYSWHLHAFMLQELYLWATFIVAPSVLTILAFPVLTHSLSFIYLSPPVVL